MKLKLSFRITYFILAVISLVIGTAIYILFRGSDLLVWIVLDKPEFLYMRKISTAEKGVFLSVFMGSAPDFLWLLSGIFALRGMWIFEPKVQMLYITLFCFIAVILEAGQYFGIIPGTFDFFDLFTMLGVASAEGIIFNVFIKRRIQHDEKT